jgi:hypothetical protein
VISCLREHLPLVGTLQVPVASVVIPTVYVAARDCAVKATAPSSEHVRAMAIRRQRATLNACFDRPDPA